MILDFTAEPEVFYVTDHYRDWPMVLLRLSKAHPETVRTLLLRSYRAVAPKTLLKAFTHVTIILGIAVLFSPTVRAQSVRNYHATPAEVL